jgi:hypothetical protein
MPCSEDLVHIELRPFRQPLCRPSIASPLDPGRSLSSAKTRPPRLRPRFQAHELLLWPCSVPPMANARTRRPQQSGIPRDSNTRTQSFCAVWCADRADLRRRSSRAVLRFVDFRSMASSASPRVGLFLLSKKRPQVVCASGSLVQLCFRNQLLLRVEFYRQVGVYACLRLLSSLFLLRPTTFG